MESKSNTFYLLILLTLILFLTGSKLINRKMLPNASNNTNENDYYEGQYKIIDGEKFYILEKEYIKHEDNSNALIRQYLVYDGTDSNKEDEPYLYTVGIANTDVDDIVKFKEELVKSDTNSLRLMPKTIVCDKVIENWKEQDYEPSYEFYDECPEGLTYEDLLKGDFRWEVFR